MRGKGKDGGVIRRKGKGEGKRGHSREEVHTI